MDTGFAKFQQYVMHVLILIGILFVVYQTLDLIYEFGKMLWWSIKESAFQIHREGRPLAALFFSILLTFEIIETIRVFSRDHFVKIRIILLVGLIAVTRKILMMDMTHAEPISELVVAAMIVALAVAYFLISRCQFKSDYASEKKEKN